MQKSAKVEIRVTPLEKESWAEAAGGARKVSAWLRALANTAAHKPSEHDRGNWPVREELTGPVTALDAVGLELGSQVGKASQPVQQVGISKGECPRWHAHRPGVYCGTCKKIN